MNNTTNCENQQKVKRYYWLKLQENFFERDEIKIIESTANGKDYVLFYMKLLLKSIHTNGRLMFKDTIPYTAEMLSTIANTNVDVVRVAVDTFIKLGLMEKLDDGALFMHEISKMLGYETEYAQKKREYRENKISQALEDKTRTNLDNLKTKKDNVRQERDIEKEIEKDTSYNPPKTSEVMDGGVWLNCIKTNGYNFDSEELRSIIEWVKYKFSKNEPILLQQVELTLKQLNAHSLAKHNIVYLIETSIARGYRGIMELTKNSVIATTPRLRYSSDEYITPENNHQKIELRNYLERCYLRDVVDPRTKVALTPEQRSIIKKHIANAHKMRVSLTDYIYKEEIMTGVCLLDQPIPA